LEEAAWQRLYTEGKVTLSRRRERMGSGELQEGTIGELLRMLAHDLRNPLAVIISNSTYLKDVVPNDDPELADTISDTLTSCEELRHIIENLDLVGLRLSKADTVAAEYSVAAAVDQAIRRCSGLASGHSVELESDSTGANAALARGVPALLERVVSNLVRNAIEHAPSGSVVRTEVGVMGDRCQVTVMDCGTQLSPDDGSTEFTPARQAASKRDPRGRYGRGLGLLCAKLAADALGADLSVIKPPPGYSCAIRFSVALICE